MDEVAEWLTDLAAGLPEEQLLPGFPAGFPPSGAAPDPLRPRRENLRELVEDRYADHVELVGALVTDLAVKPDGRVERTPMVAPTGKQSFHTMFRNQAHYIRTEPHRLREALTRWVRVPDRLAESFDHAAIHSGADDARGEPTEHAVPGATWLAIAGLPGYRLAADLTGRTTATAWRRINHANLLVWPLWTYPLSATGVRVLLEHPNITRDAVLDKGTLTLNPEGWQPLTVFRVCAARRRPSNNSDGPLTPIPVRTP
uniref:type I-G CRISPR-associated protein, Cas3-extension family n=1 Tax=Streptoalloteichus tenebrarius (strain ATCC 17920 / DSM 40477 / JCM 4838 / CBS 697.72 / NBRC 16177 / NCIMB 11028 / NRRL B-12390 / A12253. 1 / ISP 5477) TaxID=1933 RepID=UPI0036D25CD1